MGHGETPGDSCPMPHAPCPTCPSCFLLLASCFLLLATSSFVPVHRGAVQQDPPPRGRPPSLRAPPFRHQVRRRRVTRGPGPRDRPRGLRAARRPCLPS